ncbi:MAG: acyl-CoA thioesterase [Acidobacteriota bacterium]
MNGYCDCPIRVRYAETDQMGVAYYANYLVWFEVGRAEFCRQQGFTYEQVERETGSYLIVVDARCRYRRPLRYDDAFLVRTRLKAFRRRMVTFSYLLLDGAGETIYAEGETTHVVTGPDGRPKSFPPQYGKLLVGANRRNP